MVFKLGASSLPQISTTKVLLCWQKQLEKKVLCPALEAEDLHGCSPGFSGINSQKRMVCLPSASLSNFVLQASYIGVARCSFPDIQVPLKITLKNNANGKERRGSSRGVFETEGQGEGSMVCQSHKRGAGVLSITDHPYWELGWSLACVLSTMGT
jgi:hypothetical protein